MPLRNAPPSKSLGGKGDGKASDVRRESHAHDGSRGVRGWLGWLPPSRLRSITGRGAGGGGLSHVRRGLPPSTFCDFAESFHIHGRAPPDDAPHDCKRGPDVRRRAAATASCATHIGAGAPQASAKGSRRSLYMPTGPRLIRECALVHHSSSHSDERPFADANAVLPEAPSRAPKAEEAGPSRRELGRDVTRMPPPVHLEESFATIACTV